MTEQGKGGNRRTVLVTGAQGVSGRAVVEHYARLPETMVFGLSRRECAVASRARSNLRTAGSDLHVAEPLHPPRASHPR